MHDPNIQNYGITGDVVFIGIVGLCALGVMITGLVEIVRLKRRK